MVLRVLKGLDLALLSLYSLLRDNKMERFINGEVPFEHFVLTKSLKTFAEYKNPDGEVHVHVVKKMMKNPTKLI